MPTASVLQIQICSGLIGLMACLCLCAPAKATIMVSPDLTSPLAASSFANTITGAGRSRVSVVPEGRPIRG